MMLGVRLRLATHLPPSERPTPPLRQDAALPRSTVALTLAKHVTPRSGRASWLVHAW